MKRKKISSVVQNEVNQLNKVINLNLVVIRLENSRKLKKELENYLINLNKKVLIISDQKLSFSTNFIYRLVKVDSKFLYYFNNDIQYGAKFILKRLMDIIISFIVLIIISPLLLMISLLITNKGGVPFLIKQSRIGLHGRKFNMYKFKTMYNNSHTKRGELEGLNPKKGPLFKIDEDPRVIKGLIFSSKIQP